MSHLSDSLLWSFDFLNFERHVRTNCTAASDLLYSMRLNLFRSQYRWRFSSLHILNSFKPLITTLFFICVSQSYLLTALYVLTKPIICQLCRNNIFIYIRDKGLITDLTIELIRTTDLDCMMGGGSLEVTSIIKLNFLDLTCPSVPCHLTSGVIHSWLPVFRGLWSCLTFQSNFQCDSSNLLNL